MSNKQKQKQRLRTKRAQKRGARQKTAKNLRRLRDAQDQRGRARVRARKVSAAAALMTGGAHVPDITDDEHVFWLCHGANFIASDEETGVWDPVFPGIYDGQIPDANDIAVQVMTRYTDHFDDESDEIASTPGAVLAWTVSDKSTIRIVKYEAETRLRLKDPDADVSILREPHNATVWGVMMTIKQRSLARVNGDPTE